MPFTLQTTPLLAQYPDTHWQQLALQPLHALRDAVEEHPTALLGEYLNLLVLLLQAHHASSQKATGPSTKVAPATLVGLGALAALCNASLEKPDATLKSLRETILRVADDLTTVLEMAAANDSVVPWTLLSVWQVLSSSSSSPRGQDLSNAQAQILLQSGLIRQWMVTWQQQQQQDGNEKKNLLQTEMERSILHLVCAAPTTIGKYAWRFAEFAGAVAAAPSPENGMLNDVFLWNLVGCHLAEIAGGGGFVSLKKTSGATQRPAPTASTCRQRCVDAFRMQGQVIVETLSSWKDRRNQQKFGSNEEDSEVGDDAKQILQSFHAIVDALSIPLIRKLFLEIFVTTEGFDVASTLAPIRKLLVSWPSPKSHEDTKENNVGDETPESSTAVFTKADKPSEDGEDDADNVTRPKRRRGRTEVEDELVAALRKSIKVLQSTLDCGGQASSTRFSSKAD